jgi:alanine racemase
MSPAPAPLALTIDLAALARNWRRLAAVAAPAACAAVVKADAYGIGIEPAVQALAAAGCRTVFVALPQEGAEVRAAAPDTDIYVLDGFLPDAAGLYRENDLRPVLGSPEEVALWATQGGSRPSALHVDTGMNRLGLSLHEALELSRQPARLAAIAPRLLISHLACADTPDHPLNRAQLAMFSEIRAEFPNLPASLANSAGIALGPEFHFDLVRPGIALYGALYAAGRPPLDVVATLKAQILQIRDVPGGESVGYGAAETLRRDSRIAVIAAGYADGYLRAAGSGGSRRAAQAIVRGRPAPLVGRVSMDLIAIDVTGIVGVSRGDWVELFGAAMPIGDVAAAAGTIPYELLTGLSRRARRTYLPRPEA